MKILDGRDEIFKRFLDSVLQNRHTQDAFLEENSIIVTEVSTDAKTLQATARRLSVVLKADLKSLNPSVGMQIVISNWEEN